LLNSEHMSDLNLGLYVQSLLSRGAPAAPDYGMECDTQRQTHQLQNYDKY
jgi:hypothetical protein